MNKKRMLVVVDYQNDFVNGSLGFDGAEKLDEGIAALIRQYMDNGDIVLVTLDTHGTYMPYDESREGKALPVNHCEYLSAGWKLFGKTHETVMDYSAVDSDSEGYLLSICKPTFGTTSESIKKELCGIGIDAPSRPSPFSESDLSVDADKLPISEIRFVGLVADICVLSNIAVFQGMFPEAQIVLDAKLTASFDARQYLSALEIAEKSWQVRIENKPTLYVAADAPYAAEFITPAGASLVVGVGSVYDACMRVGILSARNLAASQFTAHLPVAFYHFDDETKSERENAEAVAAMGWDEFAKTAFWTVPNA